MKKRIKVLLVLFVILLVSLGIKNKSVQGYYVGQTMDIRYTDLTSYRADRPFTCTQQGVNYLCGHAAHYYRCIDKVLKTIGDPTGTVSSIISVNNTVSWSKDTDTRYKVGPYKVSYEGTLTSITINTDKGSYEKNLETGKVNTRLTGVSIGSISNNKDFYVYIDKGSGIKEITGGKIYVKGSRTSTNRYQYWWKCYAVGPGNHYSTSWGSCANKDQVQVLVSYGNEPNTVQNSDSDKLPGAPGITDLIVEKKDYYGEKENFQGAKFEIYDTNNKLLDTQTIGSDGKATFKDLFFDKYTLKEVYVPDVARLEGVGIFNGVEYPVNDIKVDISDPGNEAYVLVKDKTYFKFAGTVFLDKRSGKQRENGLIDNGEGLAGIVVKIFNSKGQEVNPKNKVNTTNSNGYFEFGYDYKLLKDETYYFRFEYDGMKYEPTTYYVSGGDTARVSKATEGRSRSNMSDDQKDNRYVFNEVNTTITGEVPRSRTIYAYTGSNGKYNKKLYGIKDSKAERTTINLGLVERPTFDASVRKDSIEFKLTSNDVPTTYKFGKLNITDKALDVELKGADLDPYIRYIRRSDLKDMQEGTTTPTLKMEILYKIRVSNTSNGFITGKIQKIRDWFDKDLKLRQGSLKVNGENVNATMQSGGKYNYIDINKDIVLKSGEDAFIEMIFDLDSQSVINRLLDSNNPLGIVENNFTEIMSYSTYYTNNDKDLNGNVIHQAGEIAGLVDIDSVPGNFKPDSTAVQEFIRECDFPANPNAPKYPAYESDGVTRGKARHDMAFKLFEDDADRSPGLLLKISPEEREISGNAFVDGANKDKLELPVGQKERIGDGFNETSNPKFHQDLNVEGIKVSMWEEKGENDKFIKSVTTDNAGNYKITSFTPGKYYLTYEYGTKGTLDTSINGGNMYNGQDYKSTLYLDELHGETNGKAWWYLNKTNSTNFKNQNDARDDMIRRNEMNKLKEQKDGNASIKNYLAEALNGERLQDPEDIKYLEDLTKITANTNRVDIEVDYPTGGQLDPYQKSSVYNVGNINFGIIERPRSELFLEEKVERITIISSGASTEVSNILVDAEFPSKFSPPKQTTGVAWKENAYNQQTRERSLGAINVTLDDTLRQGATMYIYYRLTVTNRSENIYVDSSGNEVEQYYCRGEIGNLTPAKLKAGRIVNYVGNDLLYYPENNLNTAKKEIWKKADRNSFVPCDETATDVTVVKLEGNFINRDILSIKNRHVILDASEENNSVVRDYLAPGDSRNEPLVLQQQLSSSGENGGPYLDITEIVEQVSEVGRRQYILPKDNNGKESTKESNPAKIIPIIPGNLDPEFVGTSTKPNVSDDYIKRFSTFNESDSAAGEVVTVIPPFGSNKGYTPIIVTGIVAIIILGTGIYFIKKKIL